MSRIAVVLCIAVILFVTYANLGASEGTARAATSFTETFTGAPGSPAAWQAANWEVARHTRSQTAASAMEPMAAGHGADCAAPPATHPISSLSQAVFLCRDHVMTALRADDYGLIYLTPGAMVDFSAGEAVIRWDMSTLRTSKRDWVDIWITPYEDSLQLPFDDGDVDLNGVPRRAVHIKQNDANGAGTMWQPHVYSNHQDTGEFRQFTDDFEWGLGYETFLSPSLERRDTFELRVSRTHLKFCMPQYGRCWFDKGIRDLGWTRGVVQFGHHSYTPTKDCPAGQQCAANTWHWDNVSISPAAPLGIERASPVYLEGSAGTVTLARPAPANARLRFGAKGSNLRASIDGGATSVPVVRPPQAPTPGDSAGHYASFYVDVPAGATAVRLSGTNLQAKDFHLFSPGGQAPAAPTAVVPPPTAVVPPPTFTPSATWYFAEGYTGTGFDEYLTILNPNAAIGGATISYYVQGEATPRTRALGLAANSRTTVSVHAEASPANPGGLGRLGVGHATKIDTTAGTVVERSMYFAYNGAVDGGHVVVGAAAPTTTWLFAEGYTAPGFDEYLTILNPSGSAGAATVTYYVEGQAAPRQRVIQLPASSRTTIAVHDENDPGGLGRGFQHATKVETSVPTVVERPMYFAYNGAVDGGHVAMGAAAATTWLFAEGYTAPGFDEYLTILNPSGSAGAATVTYFLSGGGPVTRAVPLAANSRTTISVHADPSADNPGGLGRLGAGHATRVVTGGLPVVVERSMYFAYNGAVDGGHVVVGAAAATTWLFAEGYTAPGFDEYLTILNPSGSAGAATVTYFLSGAGPVTRAVPLAANSRTTISVHADPSADNPGGLGRLGAGHATRVAIMNGIGVVVERPMYFTYNGAIDGGHDVLGAIAP